jgi:hypothetical protein
LGHARREGIAHDLAGFIVDAHLRVSVALDAELAVVQEPVMRAAERDAVPARVLAPARLLVEVMNMNVAAPMAPGHPATAAKRRRRLRFAKREV